MIPCRILINGPYADYQGSGSNRVVRVHSAGDVVLFPSDYATWLEENDLVEIVNGPIAQDLEVDVIEIDETKSIEITPATNTPSASDSAIDFAADHNIDLQTVHGTGSGGRILLKDVRSLVDGS